VRVPVLWLDSLHGGLKPYKIGGGNESKSLRLRDSNGKEYALRSINKSRNDVIPPAFKKTFVEEIIRDGVSMSHPYGAFALPKMLEKADIYHTEPILFYLPHQSALDTFDQKFGDDLYMLEQRPEGDWSEADNLGNFKEFNGTDKVVESILKDHHHLADQRTYLKARLLDILIADWDRHEGNWEWGERKIADEYIYIPVPKDRDQAFYTHNGLIIDRMISASGLSYMQHFHYNIGDPKALNYEERNIDRFFTNELDREDWIATAKSLQELLTSEVIEASIKGLPSEIFEVSGKELIEKLKSRIQQLPAAAESYYSFISEEVEIVGSSKREYFEVNAAPTGETTISIFRIDEGGQKEASPYYKRTFKPTETKQIRLFGIAGEDKYNINGVTKNIRLSIIGGPDKDSVVHTGKRIHIYDDKNNSFNVQAGRFHISTDSSIHLHKYDWYNYNTNGFKPVIFYNYEDRIHVGLHYQFKNYKWRREPYASKQTVGINYSLTQKSFSAFYDSKYPNLVGKWDLNLHADYDFIRWTNFFGPGNESKQDASRDITYYRMHSRELLLRAGLSHNAGKSAIEFNPFFYSVKINEDSNLCASEVLNLTKPGLFNTNNYSGVIVSYRYLTLNDSILPTKGITFSANAIYSNNFTQKEFFQKYEARLQTYIPFSKKISFLFRLGGSGIVGNDAILNTAQAYQHAVIGGPENLRGYRFDRFWGKTAYYNNNEIRYITNLKTYILNARIGVTAFFDNGRVWMPGENSDQIHTSYGGGVLLAPFNFICFGLTYGVTPESKLFQFRINTLF